MTQAELGAAMGVHAITIGLWERGSVGTSPYAPHGSNATNLGVLPVVGRIAAVLDVDPRSIAQCRRLLVPDAHDLSAPDAGQPDRRAALVPFVRWLRAMCVARGLDRAGLSLVTVVDASTAGAWLSGRRLPGDGVLPLLAALDGGEDAHASLNRWGSDLRGERGPDLRGWDPAETATIAATLDRPAAEVAAMLGRSTKAVSSERYRVRKKERADG